MSNETVKAGQNATLQCVVKNLQDYKVASMTTLLTHTVAHPTKPFFMPKTNNQPPKKFLSLELS